MRAPLQGFSLLTSVLRVLPPSGRPARSTRLSEFVPDCVAAHRFAASSSPFSRPRGLPPSGLSGPEGPDPLPQAWSPFGTVREAGPRSADLERPSWGSSVPSTTSVLGSAEPGFASPGTFRPWGFSPPRRFTPRAPCSRRSKPRRSLPLLGFGAGTAAFRPARLRVLPHSAFRPRLAVCSASNPPALRNRRSGALTPRVRWKPYFRRERPKAPAPAG